MAYNQSTSQTAQQPRNEFSTSIKYVCCKDSDKNSVKEIAAFIFDVFMNAVRKFFFTAASQGHFQCLAQRPLWRFCCCLQGRKYNLSPSWVDIQCIFNIYYIRKCAITPYVR